MKLTIETSSNVDTEIEAEFSRYLKGRGYDVARPAESWETIPQVAGRIGVHCITVSRAICAAREHVNLPQAKVHRGPNGRVLSILSNRHFDNFIRRNMTKTNGS